MYITKSNCDIKLKHSVILLVNGVTQFPLVGCCCCSFSLVQLHALKHSRLQSSALSQNLLKFMSIESMVLSSCLILCCLLLLLQSFPASGSFPVTRLFASGGQRIGASASAPVLPMNVQCLISFRINWISILIRRGRKTSTFCLSLYHLSI